MPESGSARIIRTMSRDRLWQNLALGFCIVYGAAIVINTQMNGDAMWFWYATFFHQGVKLYSGLHFILQPLYVLETAAWMRVFGGTTLSLALLAMVHVLLLAIGFQLLLCESQWADWQKAVTLASGFLICTHFNAYLFNDFHVVCDISVVYSLVLLLRLAQTEALQPELWIAAALGVLSGLTMMFRITDGAGLLAGTVLCIPALVRQRRLAAVGIFLATAAGTVASVLLATEDSLSAYYADSILSAAATKGGGGSIFSAPLLLIANALSVAAHSCVALVMLIAVVAALGYGAERKLHLSARRIFLVELAAFLLCVLVSTDLRHQLNSGALLGELQICSLIALYVLAPLLAIRLILSWRSNFVWDRRGLLVLPLFLWVVAGSASSGGRPYDIFEPLALLFVMMAVLQPAQPRRAWASATACAVLVFVAIPALRGKVRVPYAWQKSYSHPMFQDRVWYRNPWRGPMYIERDQLELVAPLCEQLKSSGSRELLSLPYPYPNYFCAIPPWHGYIQTWFDISSRATVERMMVELRAEPPRWIVYQRQMRVLELHERLYNHGQPLAQHELDDLIEEKIASGEWQLIADLPYQRMDGDDPRDGCLIIRTRP
jgi:hypothetical protein